MATDLPPVLATTAQYGQSKQAFQTVLVYAHRLDTPRHEDYAAWLRDLLAGQEPYGISDLVLSGFLQVMTNLAPLKQRVARWTGYCSAGVRSCIIVNMKTMIDLNDEDLALAAKELGTTTKKDTVNAALNFVASRRRRVEQLLNDPYALGVGPDITDPEVMRQARR